MKQYKFTLILTLVIIPLFSNCVRSYYETNFDYDIPTPTLYKYVDKTVCIYPAQLLSRDWWIVPASRYCEPQFKSVVFALNKEEAINTKADFYIRISCGVIHAKGLGWSDIAHTTAKIEARCYDSNWKLLSKSVTYGRGNTDKVHSMEEEDEAVNKAWNKVAEKLANELHQYGN